MRRPVCPPVPPIAWPAALALAALVPAVPALADDPAPRPRLPIGQILQLTPPGERPAQPPTQPSVQAAPTELRISPQAMRAVSGLVTAEPLQVDQIRRLVNPAFLPPPAPPSVTYQYVPSVPPATPPPGAPAPTVELTLCNATARSIWVAIFMPEGADEAALGTWIQLAAEGETRCGRMPAAAIHSPAFYYGLVQGARIEGEAPFCLHPASYAFQPYEDACPEGFELVGFRPVALDYPWVTEEIALALAPPDETEGEGD